MVAYSESSAAPRYKKRASRGSVPFEAATLRLADLGTTSISSNVSLQRGLARQVPQITFSALGPKPSPRRASVPSRVRTQGIPDTPFASPEALRDIGTGIGEWFRENLSGEGRARAGVDHEQRNPFSSLERSPIGRANPERVRVSGMGAGEFSDWFRK
jgi:hypothetical protein